MNSLNEKAIVVTGGSGFIGSNVCKLLVDSGFNVINIDKRKRDIDGVTQYPFEVDNKQVKGILQLLKPVAVVHIAAHNSVPYSVKNPADTYTQNVYQTINLLNNCLEAGVKNFVFASSSSVYGVSQNSDGKFKEDDLLRPVNPYGRSKKVCELIIKDYAEAYGLNYANLRLFNVAGSANGKFGYQKDPLVHVLPILTQAAMLDETFTINGADYETPDGTNLRDYTHVSDVARAFLSSVYYLLDKEESLTLNIGSGNPISTKELVAVVESKTEAPVKVSWLGKRAGDMVSTFADNSKAKELLGWDPTKSIYDIVEDEIKYQKTKIKRK